MKNGIVVYCDGDEVQFELTHDQADHLQDLAGLVRRMPQTFVEHPGPPARERVAACKREATLETILGMIQPMCDDERALVLAFLRLSRATDEPGEGMNWIRDFTRNLLYSVMIYGPVEASDQDPREILGHLAHAMRMHWDWIEDARNLTKLHPSITRQVVAAEPAADDNVFIGGRHPLSAKQAPKLVKGKRRRKAA